MFPTPERIDVIQGNVLSSRDGHCGSDDDVAFAGERPSGVSHAVVLEETGRGENGLLVERHLETVNEDDATQLHHQIIRRLQLQSFTNEPTNNQ